MIRPQRRRLSLEEYVSGVKAFDRGVLAQAITLIESNAPAHFELAQALLKALLPATGRSLRVGITGVPGVGKSTFIEALGMNLCERGHRLAVLAIDPSSTRTGGSILGDKTRMDRLSQHDNAYIRPSPSSGTLGGVARKTRETMLLCEAAGFDIIFVETVGVGQSEVTVRSMVDLFLLLMLAGAGDELQGIKKGIIELADLILVNKADGDNAARAQRAVADYNQALHYLPPATPGWQTRAYPCSALTGSGLDELWQVVQRFQAETKASGQFEQRRQEQLLEWLQSTIQTHLAQRFHTHPAVVSQRAEVEAAVLAGKMPPTAAAWRLIECYEGAR